MKRKLLLLVIGLTVALAIGIGFTLYAFWGERFEIVITEAELQGKIAEKFPITKKYLIIFEITYSDPIVHLDEGGDRIHVGLRAMTEFSLNNKVFSGNGIVAGSLRYDQESGSFFLDRLSIESMDIAGFPEKYEKEVTVLSTSSLRSYYDNHPIYTLKSTDMKQRAARLILKSVVVRNKTLVVTMGIGR